jgi:hypothetical protein
VSVRLHADPAKPRAHHKLDQRFLWNPVFLVDKEPLNQPLLAPPADRRLSIARDLTDLFDIENIRVICRGILIHHPHPIHDLLRRFPILASPGTASAKAKILSTNVGGIFALYSRFPDSIISSASVIALHSK